jgi:hypothetical protein
MIGLLLRLYPAPWRHRYGEEFRAVLESRPLGPFDVADVLIGALDARLTRFRFAGIAGLDGGPSMMLRIGGFGALFGGVLWFLGLAVASQPGGNDSPWIVVEAIGTFGLLLALTGLSAFQARRDPLLTWAAFAIPAIGSLASVTGLAAMALSPSEDQLVFGSMSAWYVWIIGLLAMLIGSILFAAVTIRAAVLSRRAAQALAISAAVVLLVALRGLGTGTDTDTGIGQVIVAASLGAFATSWIALGIMALRRGPIRASTPA